MTRKLILRDRIWIIIFMGLFFIPPFASKFINTDINSTENRTLAERPKLSFENLGGYSEAYTNYYEDNLPFKQQMVFLYDSIIYQVFNDSSVDSVITGKEGWLFYNSEVKNDGYTIAEYKRTKQYSEDEMAEIANNVTALREYIQSMKKEIVLLIIPNKEEVYSIYMPSKIKVLEYSASCDQLVEYLRDKTDVTVVYPKKELMMRATEDENVRIYQKYDTHWNNLGAVVAVHSLEEAIMGDCKTPETTYKVIDYSSVDGLSQMLNVAAVLEPEEQYIVPEYQREDKTITSNPNKFNSSVFLCGDSFRIGLKPFLAADFSRVEEAHRDLLEDNQVADSNADIVVLEFVERYVDQLKTYSFTGE